MFCNDRNHNFKIETKGKLCYDKSNSPAAKQFFLLIQWHSNLQSAVYQYLLPSERAVYGSPQQVAMRVQEGFLTGEESA